MKKQAKSQDQKLKVGYINKRGEYVSVWPWTLNKRTTEYPENGYPRYIRGSKKG